MHHCALNTVPIKAHLNSLQFLLSSGGRRGGEGKKGRMMEGKKGEEEGKEEIRWEGGVVIDEVSPTKRRFQNSICIYAHTFVINSPILIVCHYQSYACYCHLYVYHYHSCLSLSFISIHAWSMHECTYADMNAPTHAWVHLCMHGCTYACMDAPSYTHGWVYLRMHECTYIGMHECSYACMSIYIMTSSCNIKHFCIILKRESENSGSVAFKGRSISLCESASPSHTSLSPHE